MSGGVVHVKLTEFKNRDRVSTVFLSLDHNWGDGPPILFETMIFGGEHDGYQERYRTWEEAEEGHEIALAKYFSVEARLVKWYKEKIRLTDESNDETLP